LAYAFIHGNWALDNSRPDGRWCGVNNELDILRETGCYADFTFPSAPSPTQTRKINSIYYAVDDPARPKSHDWGIDVGRGPAPVNGLLLIQGPLLLDWRRRKWGLLPGVENGCIQGNQIPTIRRLETWLRARVQGQGFLGANILVLEYVDPRLYPVEPVPWTPKHYYIPSAPNQFNRVMASLEKSLRRVEDLDLAGLLDRANTLIDAANRLAGNVNQIDFGHLGTNVGSLLVEFRETTRGLQRTIDDAQNAINGADLPAVSRNTTAMEAKLSSAAVELRHVLASVDTGELNSSLANVRAATEELIVLIHNLQQRPSSVLFSKPPKPVSEFEKPPRK